MTFALGMAVGLILSVIVMRLWKFAARARLGRIKSALQPAVDQALTILAERVAEAAAKSQAALNKELLDQRLVRHAALGYTFTFRDFCWVKKFLAARGFFVRERVWDYAQPKAV